MLYVYLSGCSFASGGDSDSLDYIAYVAKDNAGIALTTHSCWHFMYSSTETLRWPVNILDLKLYITPVRNIYT
jgi:hypothetical protein